jgi:hypothetical protein
MPSIQQRFTFVSDQGSHIRGAFTQKQIIMPDSAVAAASPQTIIFNMDFFNAS